jgi:putative restriction endonuclease
MHREHVLHLFEKLNVWSRGDERAPHKPLLVLYALGRWSRGETADVSFEQLDPVLTGLLKEFDPPRQSYHTEYPAAEPAGRGASRPAWLRPSFRSREVTL